MWRLITVWARRTWYVAPSGWLTTASGSPRSRTSTRLICDSSGAALFRQRSRNNSTRALSSRRPATEHPDRGGRSRLGTPRDQIDETSCRQTSQPIRPAAGHRGQRGPDLQDSDGCGKAELGGVVDDCADPPDPAAGGLELGEVHLRVVPLPGPGGDRWAASAP